MDAAPPQDGGGSRYRPWGLTFPTMCATALADWTGAFVGRVAAARFRPSLRSVATPSTSRRPRVCPRDEDRDGQQPVRFFWGGSGGKGGGGEGGGGHRALARPGHLCCTLVARQAEWGLEMRLVAQQVGRALGAVVCAASMCGDECATTETCVTHGGGPVVENRAILTPQSCGGKQCYGCHRRPGFLCCAEREPTHGVSLPPPPRSHSVA